MKESLGVLRVKSSEITQEGNMFKFAVYNTPATQIFFLGKPQKIVPYCSSFVVVEEKFDGEPVTYHTTVTSVQSYTISDDGKMINSLVIKGIRDLSFAGNYTEIKPTPLSFRAYKTALAVLFSFSFVDPTFDWKDHFVSNYAVINHMGSTYYFYDVTLARTLTQIVNGGSVSKEYIVSGGVAYFSSKFPISLDDINVLKDSNPFTIIL